MPSAGECLEATVIKESSMDEFGSEIVLVSAVAEGPQGDMLRFENPPIRYGSLRTKDIANS
jgi:hypothetical protein